MLLRAMLLQIAGKDLGALAMKGFCPRCFWISRRAQLRWQIFPGIFSSIDSYSKKVVHGQFDKSGMPGWLAPLGELKGYKDPPSAHRFRVPVEEKPGFPPARERQISGFNYCNLHN